MSVEINPENKFPTVEEWVAHRYKQGQVVPEGHPAYQDWMKDFE